MTKPPQPTAAPWLLLFIAVCLVTINLRITITGVGPMLDEIADDQGVSPAALGALASVPLFVWAVISPLAQALAARIGINAAVSWSLVVLMIATVWRSLPGSPINLWLGTALTGAAIAIGNVLLPAVIKRDFSGRVPLVMGIYSTLLGVAGALGAGMVAPISHLSSESGELLGWRPALLATGFLIPISLIVWLWATKRPRGTRDQSSAAPPAVPKGLARRVWRDPVAWLIALYLGSQSWSFYIFATWLAPIDLSFGTDPVTAGLHLMVFHIATMVGSFITPFISRGAMRRWVPVFAPILASIGGAGVMFAPGALLLWFTCCGLAIGWGIVSALTFIAQRSASTEVASAVSGMSQSVGYLIAALGPILFGWLHELSGDWVLPLFALLLGTTVQFCMGIMMWRERMALPEPSR